MRGGNLRVCGLIFFWLFAAGESAELIYNNAFENSGLSGWHSYVLNTADKIMPQTFTWGTDIYFYMLYGGSNPWDAQLWQGGLHVRPGYKYVLSFGGSGVEGGRNITVGVDHNGEPTSLGGDGSGTYTSYMSLTGALAYQVYKEFSMEWTNTSVFDANVRIRVDGGGSSTDFSIAWISLSEAPVEVPTGGVRMNQTGFFTTGSKRAVLRDTGAADFQVRNSSTGEVVLSGSSGPKVAWAPSGETVRMADFTTLSQQGTFTLYVNDQAVSDPFAVSSAPYLDLAKGLLKFYYYQRASIELTSAYAGTWSRPLGHPDTKAYIYPSVLSYISAPKGWYDAGDYGKYVVNSGISVYSLLELYDHFPDFLKTLSLNIPESGNGVPDILNEARWNLEWMLSMQDLNDGGVYHKLTPEKFDDFIMPDRCTATRYVFMKTTAAACDFAAVTAMASRVYRDFDTAFAARCLRAARKAYAWSEGYPNVPFVQPTGVTTGDYADTALLDERFWAAVELGLAAGDPLLLDTAAALMPASIPIPDWQHVAGLGLYSLLTHQDLWSGPLTDSAGSIIARLADGLMSVMNLSGYGVSMASADYYWGSNSVAANQGMILLHRYYQTKQKKYLDAAQQQLDYLLGRNPCDVCYVTGFGKRSPMNPHHRISLADGKTQPIPGMLVGGPHTGGEDVADVGIDYRHLPADSWVDFAPAYAVNEVAINWNAAIAYLCTSLEALYSGTEVKGFKPAQSFVYGTAGTAPRKFDLCSFSVGGSVELLRFALPERCFVSVRYFDLRGRVVGSFINKQLEAGNYSVPVPFLSGLGHGSYVRIFTAGSFVRKGMVCLW